MLREDSGMSVGRIAELTGFSSGSYFSKCFTEEFGCKPSAYAEKHSGNMRREPCESEKST